MRPRRPNHFQDDELGSHAPGTVLRLGHQRVVADGITGAQGMQGGHAVRETPATPRIVPPLTRIIVQQGPPIPKDRLKWVRSGLPVDLEPLAGGRRATVWVRAIRVSTQRGSVEVSAPDPDPGAA